MILSHLSDFRPFWAILVILALGVWPQVVLLLQLQRLPLCGALQVDAEVRNLKRWRKDRRAGRWTVGEEKRARAVTDWLEILLKILQW